MPVTVDGKKLYSKAELDALIASANQSVPNMWEAHYLNYVNGYNIGGGLHTIFKNKHTGACTGVLGFNNIQTGRANSTTFATDTSLALHPDMLTPWAGHQIFTSCTATLANTANVFTLRNVNVQVMTDGRFILGGDGFADATEHLENMYYLCKDAKIVDTPPHVTYLSEGAFYDQDTVDLYTGKAWLRTKYDSIDGYDSSTHFTYLWFYKNLWSGEVIMQYRLYPKTPGTWSALPLGYRYAPRRAIFIKPRYMEAQPTSVLRTMSCNFCVRSDGSVITYGVLPDLTCTWLTGSNFWIGRAESPGGNRTETTPLWHHDSASPIPSMNTNAYSSLSEPRATELVETYTNHVNHTYWAESSDMHTDYTGDHDTLANNEVTHVVSCRSGMIYNYFDLRPTPANINASGNIVSPIVLQNYSVPLWVADKRYFPNNTAEQGRLYYMGLVYESEFPEGTAITLNADGSYTYSAHYDLHHTNCLVHTTGTVTSDGLAAGFGSTGGMGISANNRLIMEGWYLCDTNATPKS